MTVSEKLERFEKALQLFLDRVRSDPNLLAAVQVGSLTEETIWRRDAISLWLIEKDGVTKRLRADGEDLRRRGSYEERCGGLARQRAQAAALNDRLKPANRGAGARPRRSPG